MPPLSLCARVCWLAAIVFVVSFTTFARVDSSVAAVEKVNYSYFRLPFSSEPIGTAAGACLSASHVQRSVFHGRSVFTFRTDHGPKCSFQETAFVQHQEQQEAYVSTEEFFFTVTVVVIVRRRVSRTDCPVRDYNETSRLQFPGYALLAAVSSIST